MKACVSLAYQKRGLKTLERIHDAKDDPIRRALKRTLSLRTLYRTLSLKLLKRTLSGRTLRRKLSLRSL